MIATQFFLLAATAVAPLASNAAPIFSGMLARRAADNNVQLAQGTNFYFTNLRLEDVCQPGQVACVGGNRATCSQEANWEIEPCTNNSLCFATPNSDGTNINVQCMAESDANAAIESAGGQGGLSVDFQVNEAPFPAPDNGQGEQSPSASGEAPTATEDPNAPGETCIPDDGSEEGEQGGQEGEQGGQTEGGEQGGEQTPEPTPTGTLAEEPTESCTADSGAEGPEETITLILVPNEDGTYATQTFTGGELPLATEAPEVTGAPVPVPEASEGPVTNLVPTDNSADTGAAAPTETCTESDGGYEGGYGGGDATAAPAPTEELSSSSGSAAPTTLTVGTPPASVPAPNGGVNVIGTHNIPAPTGAVPAKRFVKKVQRS